MVGKIYKKKEREGEGKEKRVEEGERGEGKKEREIMVCIAFSAIFDCLPFYLSAFLSA